MTMPSSILGLDIGGANLKAATCDRQAISVPFALWKQPDKLSAALAELVSRFPDAVELAVTMTGELCDCFETRGAGVDAIVRAVRFACDGRRIRIWSTGGAFLTDDEAQRDYLKVASANWHALATFAGRLAPHHNGLLLDIGSTTTDIIPLSHGLPCTRGSTDCERLMSRELVYLGVRRTPVCALHTEPVCAELFATTQDVFVVLGSLPEEERNLDTADGRPLTRDYARARLARMLGGDRGSLSDDQILCFASRVNDRIRSTLAEAVRAALPGLPGSHDVQSVILSGAGTFLARQVIGDGFTGIERIISLDEELGPTVSTCAPAHAVAVLAAEAR